MQAGSKSRFKGEIVNGKWQSVLQECKWHEQDARSGGSGILSSSGHWWTVRPVWRCICMWNGEWWCESVQFGVIWSGRYLGGVSQPCGPS